MHLDHHLLLSQAPEKGAELEELGPFWYSGILCLYEGRSLISCITMSALRVLFFVCWLVGSYF